MNDHVKPEPDDERGVITSSGGGIAIEIKTKWSHQCGVWGGGKSDVAFMVANRLHNGPAILFVTHRGQFKA